MKYFVLSTAIIFFISIFFQSCIGISKHRSSVSIENRISELDKRILGFENDVSLMGSFLIKKDGKILYDKTFGTQFIPKDTHINPENIKYRIGSITKIYTSAMIHKAIGDDYIQYDTKLAVFFPKIKNSELITIKDMLYHRSGIYNYTVTSGFLEWAETFRIKEEMLELIYNFELASLPNETIAYSNSNYLLLGYILETIYQKPYKYIVKELITDILGLKNTLYAETISIDNNEIYSFVYNNNVIEISKEMNLSVTGGAGSLVSTMEEMAIFIEGLFENKLIPENIVLNMIEPIYDIGRGMFLGKGIFKIFTDSGYFYGHEGSVDNFYTILLYESIEKITITFCVNGINGNIYSVIEEIKNILFE